MRHSITQEAQKLMEEITAFLERSPEKLSRSQLAKELPFSINAKRCSAFFLVY